MIKRLIWVDRSGPDTKDRPMNRPQRNSPRAVVDTLLELIQAA